MVFTEVGNGFYKELKDPSNRVCFNGYRHFVSEQLVLVYNMCCSKNITSLPTNELFDVPNFILWTPNVNHHV